MNTRSEITLAQIAEHSNDTPRKAVFCLVPRYTGGSPGSHLFRTTTIQVAGDEVEAFNASLEGIYGEEKQKLAETKGLFGIAYARWEKGRKVWRKDLITGQQFIEPPRLEHEDMERMKNLRHQKLIFGESMDREFQAELLDLERRAELHRQEVR